MFEVQPYSLRIATYHSVIFYNHITPKHYTVELKTLLRPIWYLNYLELQPFGSHKCMNRLHFARVKILYSSLFIHQLIGYVLNKILITSLAPNIEPEFQLLGSHSNSTKIYKLAYVQSANKTYNACMLVSW